LQEISSRDCNYRHTQILSLLLNTCRDGKKKHAPHSALSRASNFLSIVFPPRVSEGKVRREAVRSFGTRPTVVLSLSELATGAATPKASRPAVSRLDSYMASHHAKDEPLNRCGWRDIACQNYRPDPWIEPHLLCPDSWSRVCALLNTLSDHLSPWPLLEAGVSCCQPGAVACCDWRSPGSKLI
jgi:hypothetical protein